ncbi:MULTISPECIES: hypothetical protein [unclassified Synechocystis]|nr:MULTISPECIES: hypothetical protein [unclassified Synechocystis]
MSYSSRSPYKYDRRRRKSYKALFIQHCSPAIDGIIPERLVVSQT